MDAALVNGNEARGVAEFEEDSRGDLVDILYHCTSRDALPYPSDRI